MVWKKEQTTLNRRKKNSYKPDKNYMLRTWCSNRFLSMKSWFYAKLAVDLSRTMIQKKNRLENLVSLLHLYCLNFSWLSFYSFAHFVKIVMYFCLNFFFISFFVFMIWNHIKKDEQKKRFQPINTQCVIRSKRNNFLV